VGPNVWAPTADPTTAARKTAPTSTKPLRPHAVPAQVGAPRPAAVPIRCRAVAVRPAAPTAPAEAYPAVATRPAKTKRPPRAPIHRHLAGLHPPTMRLAAPIHPAGPRTRPADRHQRAPRLAAVVGVGAEADKPVCMPTAVYRTTLPVHTPFLLLPA